jgi:hypothetical protein
MLESELMGAIGGQGMGLERDFDDDLLLISAVCLDLVQGNGKDVKIRVRRTFLRFHKRFVTGFDFLSCRFQDRILVKAIPNLS